MSLFQLAEDFSALYEQIDRIDPEEEHAEELLCAIMDTLEGLEAELNTKAENVALFIKLLEYDAAAIRAEELMLASRRKAKEAKAERFKQYLMNQMLYTDKKKIETPRAMISIRQNPESVKIEDERAVMVFGAKHQADYLIPQEPKIDKTKLKKLLQGGTKVTGAHLERGMSLRIQ